ncbi:MAG: ABC transporter permease [Chloroflexota bacterium]
MHRVRDELRRALDPALALLTAFLLGAVVIVLTDFDHLRLLGSDPIAAISGAFGGLVRGYGAMLTGAIGSPARFAVAIQTGTPEAIAAAIRPMTETLVSATPFIFAGLGLAVSFRAGLFNLGADGQFAIGALGATIAATLLGRHLPLPAALAVVVAGGAIGGGAYAFVPGVLKVATGAHEVITTLMLNGIAGMVVFFVAGWMGLWGPPAVPPVPRLTDLPGIRVDLGFVIGLLMAVVVSWLLFRTTLGFELRATGHSGPAARVAGMQPGRATILAMTVSGALVGMGSALFSFGPAWGSPGVPEESMGYVAIALALLGGRRPSGVVAAALLYGALTTGALSMVVETGIPLALLSFVVAMAIMFAAAPELTRSIWRLPAKSRASRP